MSCGGMSAFTESNRTVLILILVYFEWRDNENQQFGTDFLHVNGAQNINQGGE